MSRILIVEDESIIAADIRRVLRSLGYEVEQPASSCEEALQAIATVRPALVLMDIHIRGERDGIDTAMLIRRQWNIPIVYLTSHSDEATLARAKQTGPYGYILKPFEERDIRTAIEVALAKHELEVQLAERDRWFATTLHSIGDAVIAVDRDQRITFMNAVASTLTGWSAEQACGRALDEVFRLVDGSGAPLAQPMAGVLEHAFIASLPPATRLITHSNAQLEIDDSAAPIVDDVGRLLGGVVVFRDVTDQRRLERRVAQTERMASIGTLSAGIAHEINNPLTVATGAIDLIAQALARIDGAAREGAIEAVVREAAGLAEVVADARDGISRVARIVRSLRMFTRVGDVSSENLDIPEVVASALKLTADPIRVRAQLQVELGTTPLVLADEGRLVQVMTNMLLNAAQAMVRPDPRTNLIRIATHTDDEGRAVIEVHDNGPGIAAEHLPRLFEPFFTTKRVGAGMGLGLSIAHGIVQGFGGALTVESELGAGSVFRVSLPPARAPKAPADTSGATWPLAPVATRRAQVLVVDDDELVARTVQRALQSLHDVVIETDPRKAAARLLANDEVDVIICDVTMPELSGVELLELLRRQRPECVRKLIFLTGGFLDAAEEVSLRRSDLPLLEKPVAQDVLRAAVAARLTALVGGD